MRPEGPDGKPVGAGFIAVDNAQAGPDDRVLVLTEGNGVRQILGKDAGPIRSLIVGIIDDVQCEAAVAEHGAAKVAAKSSAKAAVKPAAKKAGRRA